MHATQAKRLILPRSTPPPPISPNTHRSLLAGWDFLPHHNLSLHVGCSREYENLVMRYSSDEMKIKSESEVAQLCPTLCDPVDCSPPCSSVHGVFQARVLEWVAISFSRGSSWPRDQTQVSRIVSKMLYCLSHQGSLCILKQDSGIFTGIQKYPAPTKKNSQYLASNK